LSEVTSQQCKTLSGSWPQEHRYYESVGRHLFQQAPQWPSDAVRKRFDGDHCCPRLDRLSSVFLGDITTDDRSFEMHLANAMDVAASNVYFYPRLIPIVSVAYSVSHYFFVLWLLKTSHLWHILQHMFLLLASKCIFNRCWSSFWCYYTVM